MKQIFRPTNFREGSLWLIAHCERIIKRYMVAGLRLTLRQLYYQLVTVNAVANSEKSYKHLSSLVSDARLAGLLDWDAIEDRVRKPIQPPEFGSLEDLIESAIYSYRLPRWEGQRYYVELWVEKDALAGVLAPLALQFHVVLMVNRGYSSQSAMFESAKRLAQQEKPIILYLGDHDPSGEDMVRDIEQRLVMFGIPNIVVRKLALTMDQVEKYKLPPNPAKLTDPRAQEYIDKYGNQSWEVDALPPEVLSRLISAEFAGLIDTERMDKVLQKEDHDKKRLRGLVNRRPKDGTL